jgi:hypothetical protein
VTRAATTTSLICLVAAALAMGGGAAWAQQPRRMALIVGANGAPPGRRPLRYSHEDARRVAEVLTQVADFAGSDVSVLLDPTPQAVLDAFDRLLSDAEAAGREAVLFFYYSGHADDVALYPAGQALPMAQLKPRLEDARAKVRIGIIDSCRGGGWTGTKGLAATEPFDVNVPFGLSNEGSILIASSSGFENAHESESLRGSFFTHHWNGGLLGAADRNGDGRVTIGEAFEYARTRTIRDTALVTQTPQHPSFHMNLGGRQDFAIAAAPSRGSALVLDQEEGPLELVNLDSGLVVVESARGRIVLRLALAPGRYLVRRRDAAGISAREVEIPVNGEARIGEQRLELIRPAVLTSKGGVPRIAAAAVIPPHHWALGFAFGVRHARVMDPGLRVSDESGDLTGILRAIHGLAPGWQAVLPLAVARAGGRPGSWEWVLWGGLPVLGASHDGRTGAIVNGALGSGLDLRRPLGRNGDLDLGLSALGTFRWTGQSIDGCQDGTDPCVPPLPSRQPPTTWTVQVTVGYTHRLADVVTFNLAVGAAGNAFNDGGLPTFGLREPSLAPVVAVGSLQRRGLLPQPLIRVDLDEHLALDVYAAFSYEIASRTITETYMAGASWFW